MEEDEVGRLDCGHGYHTSCIKQWLLLKNLCPICKASAYSKCWYVVCMMSSPSVYCHYEYKLHWVFIMDYVLHTITPRRLELWCWIECLACRVHLGQFVDNIRSSHERNSPSAQLDSILLIYISSQQGHNNDNPLSVYNEYTSSKNNV